MAGVAWERRGTIAVLNGSKAVTGVDTVWSGGVVSQGDIILLPNGSMGEVDVVTSNTSLSLKQAYAGATASAQAYAVIRMLPSGNVAADLAAKFLAVLQRYNMTIDQLVALLSSTGTASFSDGTTTIAGLRGLRGLSDLAALVDELVSADARQLATLETATLKFALDQAAVANKSIQALKQQLQQEGEFTIVNRGVMSGCSVAKSTTATRSLNLVGGRCFAQGRRWPVADAANAASVPANAGSSAATVYAYLYQDAAVWKLGVTAVGQSVPAGAITLYNITVPANNTTVNDPNLVNVTLTDVRRLEPQFPLLLDSPATASVVLSTLAANDYRLAFDVVSAQGAPCEEKCIVPTSRATNGFTVQLASAADNVTVRWRASKLNN